MEIMLLTSGFDFLALMKKSPMPTKLKNPVRLTSYRRSG